MIGMMVRKVDAMLSRLGLALAFIGAVARCNVGAPPGGNGNDNGVPNDNVTANDNSASNDNASVNANDNASGNENDNTGGGNANDNSSTNDNSGLPPLGVDIDIPDEGHAHVPAGTQVTYVANPPASGSHWSSLNPPAPASPGFYDERLEEEQWVHNLEHGYVVVLYDCKGTCAESFLDDLRAFVDSAPASEKFGYAKLVVAPYDGLPYRLTCIAWDIQLHLDAFDGAVMSDFYERYLDHGPEDAP